MFEVQIGVWGVKGGPNFVGLLCGYLYCLFQILTFLNLIFNGFCSIHWDSTFLDFPSSLIDIIHYGLDILIFVTFIDPLSFQNFNLLKYCFS